MDNISVFILSEVCNCSSTFQITDLILPQQKLHASQQWLLLLYKILQGICIQMCWECKLCILCTCCACKYVYICISYVISLLVLYGTLVLNLIWHISASFWGPGCFFYFLKSMAVFILWVAVLTVVQLVKDSFCIASKVLVLTVISWMIFARIIQLHPLCLEFIRFLDQSSLICNHACS